MKILKVLKVIYSIFRTLLAIVLIALLAIVLTQRFTDNRMAIAGIRIFTVVTESMVPEYQVGDAILVITTKPEELQVGDDITYLGLKDTFADKIVTHRIVEIGKNKDESYKITTKGIANDKEDPTINETQVYGKVVYKIKSISYINGIIGNLYGMYFVIVVPMAIMIFVEYINYKKDKKKEDEEEEEEKNKNDNNDDDDNNVSKENTKKDNINSKEDKLIEQRKKKRQERKERIRKRHKK